MKLKLILLVLFTASIAQAQDYLCPNGTRITQDSRASVIQVTIGGVQMECKLTADGPSARTCSVQSTPIECVNTPAGHADCRTQWNQGGKCVPIDKLGSDGNVICGCGVGE
jgi:hypothetical protein